MSLFTGKTCKIIHKIRKLGVLEIFAMKIQNLIIPAIVAAVDAGAAILSVYHQDFAVEEKADKSPLTIADKKAHEIIAAHLAPGFRCSAKRGSTLILLSASMGQTSGWWTPGRTKNYYQEKR
ncbi:MAG: hypothetical protein R2875_01630 [Desulfobacterales bacterium]